MSTEGLLYYISQANKAMKFSIALKLVVINLRLALIRYSKQVFTTPQLDLCKLVCS